MRTLPKTIERRAKVRFPMQRELRYKLLEGQKLIGSGTGATSDMSSGGVAFISDRPLSAGAFIELSISWPVRLDNGCPMRLIIFGKVLRTGPFQSVCTVEKYEFRTQARAVPFAAPARNDAMLQRWAKEYVKTQTQQASA